MTFALPATALAEDAQWSWISVELYDLEPEKVPTLIVLAQLTEETPLPYTGSLSVPKGSTISWVGEIYGGDPSADPAIAVTVEELPNYDLVNFTLTESPRVQLEVALPETSLSDTATGRMIDLDWISNTRAERGRIAIAVPQAYHLENVTPTPTADVRASDVFYWIESVPLTPGQTLELAGTMATGAAPELEQAISDAGSTTETTSIETTVTEDIAMTEADTDIEAIPLTTSSDDAEEDAGRMQLIVGLLAIVAVLAGIVVIRVRANREKS